MMNKNHRKSSLQILNQKGVVLFFALIALVVLMLAAVALIRSVDSSTSVAGNLAFKQSATTSADSGLETAIGVLAGTSLALNENNSANAALGYYATAEEKNLTTTPEFWDNAHSAFATGTNVVDGRDPSGNTTRFIIERMCTKVGDPSTSEVVKASCLYGLGKEGGGSKSGVCGYDPCPVSPPVSSPMYRVTARVTGPKNTVSYVQAYLY